MLTLERTESQKILIGPDIVIKVLRIDRRAPDPKVRLGIDCPKDIRIWREDLYLRLLRADPNSIRYKAEPGPTTPEQDIKQLTAERDLLAFALWKACNAAGLLNPETPRTVPQLMLLANVLALWIAVRQ